MLMIRDCKTCGGRIRTTAWSVNRPCPYCKTRPSEAMEPGERMDPSRAEWAIWTLGLLTEAVGIILPVAILILHGRLLMSWLGAGLVGTILAFFFMVIGRVARIGTPKETIFANLIVLVMLYFMMIYGLFAFAPLDALGGTVMPLIAVGTIVMYGVMDDDPRARRKAEKGRIAGWFILFGFLTAYLYHALQPWLRH